MQRIRAVVFDLGNTLWHGWNSRPMEEMYAIEAQRLAPLFARWDIDPPAMTEALLREVWEMGEEESARERAAGTHREMDVAAGWMAALGRRGVAITRGQAEELWVTGWIPVREFGIELYPGVIEVLRTLRDAGLLIGINTNRACTGAMLMRDLEDFGIAAYVDAAVCSGDTGYCKPHPSTFELVLKMLDVSAAEAVMVGDLCGNDIAGAKALGMVTVLKANSASAPPCADADYVIRRLHEVVSLPFAGEAGSARLEAGPDRRRIEPASRSQLRFQQPEAP